MRWPAPTPPGRSEGVARGHGVAGVAGHGHPATALGDVAVVRFRGRLHGTTMTDDEHPTTPDDAAGGSPDDRPTIPCGPAGRRGCGQRSRRPAPDDPPGSPLDTSGDGPTRPLRPLPHPTPPPGLRPVLWGFLLVLVAAVVISSQIKLNYYAIQPGTAQPVQPFITVPPSKGAPGGRSGPADRCAGGRG